MDPEDELAELSHPISLPKPAQIEPEVVNLYPLVQIYSHPHRQTQISSLLVDWVVFHPLVELQIFLKDHQDN